MTHNADHLINDDTAIICDTHEEAINILKTRYPDIEEGYGSVHTDGHTIYVYEHPGLTTRNHDTAKALLLKHGSLPLHEHASVFGGQDGFSLSKSKTTHSTFDIRYNAKLAKKRQQHVADAAATLSSRLTLNELHAFLQQVAAAAINKHYTMRVLVCGNIKISKDMSKALFMATLIASFGDVKTLPEYDELATRWRTYKKFPAMNNNNASDSFNNQTKEAIELLKQLFATKRDGHNPDIKKA
jgi:hypothetical protein